MPKSGGCLCNSEVDGCELQLFAKKKGGGSPTFKAAPKKTLFPGFVERKIVKKEEVGRKENIAERKQRNH